MARRTLATDEQKQMRRTRDKQLRDNAQAVLDDPEAFDRMETALASTSARIHGYSDRNRALLFTQAVERGLVLSDVATFKQWRERGRQVRKGERALRIVAPKGREDRDPDEETGDKGMRGNDEQDTGKEGGESTRFRMLAVFDLSQTDAVVTEADAVDTTDAAGRFAGPDWGSGAA